MKHHSTFDLEYESDETARIVAQSLALEIGEIDDDRSRTQLQRTGHRVRIEVAARDLVSLRAAMNTWLSLVSVSERVQETIDF